MNYQDAVKLISLNQHKTIWESFLKKDNISSNSEYQNINKRAKADKKTTT